MSFSKFLTLYFLNQIKNNDQKSRPCFYFGQNVNIIDIKEKENLEVNQI